jgi:hypothetical protein
MITDEAECSQSMKLRCSRRVNPQVGMDENSGWAHFRIIQAQWLLQTPPMHLWLKECQL